MTDPTSRPSSGQDASPATQPPASLEDCLFCRWVRQERPVDCCGSVAAFEDGHPVTEGHLLIVPRRHTADGRSMTREETCDAETLIRRLMDRIQNRDSRVTGFNLGMNLGRSAGQTVFHAHIHLIPRRDGDTDDPRGGVRGVIPGRRSY